MNTPASLPLSGSLATPQTLKPGWNLIGPATSINATIDSYLATIMPSGYTYASVWRWNNGPYVQLNPAIDRLEPGSAYWVDVQIAPPSPFSPVTNFFNSLFTSISTAFRSLFGI